ncbi:replication protein RepA [Paracraurococcus ruber]|uniref:Pirin n=1 Tax=Paracraurococcus ruber TaxID=77675 RepID=A0ABS1D5A9_9PROT|nr:replication protein RepA [Paracraurococcus ruber]MBK1661683.1 pirin [Paracraurococcus ruber]TDG18064.1 pirin [Paracraurococcus ruber]
MGDVHQLILKHGLDGARAMAATKAERVVIDAAATLMAEEESRLGITHAGFAMTSLPHKRIEEGFWRREGHRTTLLVESGRDRAGKIVGVPYGSIARLILLYLQTEAIRTNSPEVELGRSMKSWMGRMNLSTGGKTYQLVTEQARRISACRLTFFADRDGLEARHNGAFVQDAITLSGLAGEEAQGTLWQDRVRLDDGFWRSLRDHPVPIREEAIKAIGTRSLAIDVYIWLAYRLHSLGKTTSVSWPAIHAQFGAGFRLVRQLKPSFTEALNLAMAVYPEARVDVTKDGLTLHPSPPAVPKLEARRLGLG